MKRALIVVGVVVLLLVVVVGGVVAMTFMGRNPVVDGAEVGGARIVADGIVTAAVVPVGEGKVALIDAGNDTEATAILADLSRRGLSADAVTAILLTHGHQDHIGGVRKFPNAAVIAMDGEAALIEGREGAKGPATRLFPVSPTGITVSRRLRDGEVFMVGDVQVQAFAVPGHTAGSAAYLVNGVLFVGDSADIDSDGRLQGAPWIFSDSQEQNRASLISLDQRLRNSGAAVRAIVPAHSGAVTDGLTQLDAFAGR